MDSSIPERIESFLSTHQDIEVVDVRLGSHGGRTLVQVLLDKEGGIGLDDLMEVNRHLSKVMDTWDISDAYMLEVSSAGLERPLTKLKDFARFTERKVKLVLHEPIEENRRKVTGIIKGVEAEIISLETESQTFKIAYKNIKKANLVFEM